MDPLQQLEAANGGRPLANDDLLVLQGQGSLLGLPALLTGLPPCIVSGCGVFKTGNVWNVAPGMVWDGAVLLPFTGRSNVALPAMFAPGAVQVADSRSYQDGATKTTIKSQSMDLVAPVAGSTNLVLETYGALTIWHRIHERTRYAKEVQWIATLDTTHYDANGLGLPGTSGWGWGLCDGQGGRIDLRGRFVAGLDLSQPDYNNIGNIGGAEQVTLTTPQLPAHQHTVTYSKTDSALGSGNNDWSRIAAGHPNARANTSTVSTDPQGSGLPIENRPPFYVLAARQWVGF